MAEQEEEKIENIIEDVSLEKKKGRFNSKVFIIGVPLFIVQLVAVYFITANLLLSQIEKNNPSKDGSSKTKTEQVKNDKKIEYGKYLYSLDDIIANPANTDGKRLVLASVALDLKSEDEEQKLKKREAVVRDIITSALSSKNLEQLSQNDYRDSLKIGIAQNIQKMLPDIHLNKVYFSKFIIQ